MTEISMVFMTLLVLIIGCCFNLLSLFKKIQSATIKFREKMVKRQEQEEQQQKRRLKSIDLKVKKAVVDRQFEAEIYLIADLNLGMLAHHTNIPASQLSQLFSSVYHSNFNKIINEYRIDYAVKLLQDHSLKHSIDEICIMSGFSSRSSFYRAFRSVFDMTPSEYKRQRLDF